MSTDTAGVAGRIARGIRVLEDRVLVRRDRPVDRSRGGIILPDQSKEVPDEGEVVAVGPGKACPELTLPESPEIARIPMSVVVGDKVVFLKYAGTTLRHEGEDLVVLREADVIAVVEPVPPTLPDDSGAGVTDEELAGVDFAGIEDDDGEIEA